MFDIWIPIHSPHLSVTDLLCHFFKRLQLRVVDEAELRDEVVVVFVAGVDVGLSSHTTDHVKVMDVHVYKHPKQAAQYLLAHLLKVLWKRDSYSCRKDVLIVDEGLDPVHQKVHVYKSRQFGGLLVLIPILPPVFITWPSRHDGTALLSAELAHGPIDEVDTIEEIHHMHSYPVINVLSVWQLHHFPQVQA